MVPSATRQYTQFHGHTEYCLPGSFYRCKCILSINNAGNPGGGAFGQSTETYTIESGTIEAFFGSRISAKDGTRESNYVR
jgi:hypothetical protein